MAAKRPTAAHFGHTSSVSTESKALQHATTHRNTLDPITTHCSASARSKDPSKQMQSPLLSVSTEPNTLQYTTTHRNTPLLTTTHRDTTGRSTDQSQRTQSPLLSLSSEPNTPQHTTTHRFSPQRTATQQGGQKTSRSACNVRSARSRICRRCQRNLTPCNTPQHTASHHNTLQHNTLQHNTLQHNRAVKRPAAAHAVASAN